MKRIGILGGTFDPPHVGHTALARAALEQLNLDEVILVPASKNPLKHRQGTSAKDRLAMTELAVEDEPGLGCSDIDVTRGGSSYAVDTLEELRMVQPAHYWFVCGVDAVASLEEWKNPDRLLSLCRLAVVGRDGRDVATVVKHLRTEHQLAIDTVVMEPLEVSSTQVRTAVELGRPVFQWLKPKVWEYIQKVGLYRE